MVPTSYQNFVEAVIQRKAIFQIGKRLVFALMVIGCSACSYDSAKSTADTKAGVHLKNHEQVVSDRNLEQQGATTEMATNRVVNVARDRKPGANVTLVNNDVFTMMPGEEKYVTLKLATGYPSGEMRVEVKTNSHLIVLAGAGEHVFDLAEGIEYEVPLRLTAPRNGRYYVNLHISVQHEGSFLARSISAIIQVGSDAEGNHAVERQKAGKVSDVISMPADEEIIQE